MPGSPLRSDLHAHQPTGGLGVVIYNEGLFTDKDLQVPAPTWTWTGLRDAAFKLTGGSGSGRIWGFHHVNLPYVVEVYLRQVAKDDRWWANEPHVQTAYRLFTEMIRTDQSTPPMTAPPNGAPSPTPEVGITRGNVGISITTLQTLQAPAVNGLTLGVLPVPSVSGATPVTVARAQTLMIPAAAKQPDAAWELLQFIVGPEGASVVARSGSLPAYQSDEVAQLLLDRKPPLSPGLQAVLSHPVKSIREDDPQGAGKYGPVVRYAAQEAFTGRASWEDAFAIYQERMAKLKERIATGAPARGARFLSPGAGRWFNPNENYPPCIIHHRGGTRTWLTAPSAEAAATGRSARSAALL